MEEVITTTARTTTPPPKGAALRMVAAKDLKPGDVLETLGGQRTVKAVSLYADKASINFTDGRAGMLRDAVEELGVVVPENDIDKRHAALRKSGAWVGKLTMPKAEEPLTWEGVKALVRGAKRLRTLVNKGGPRESFVLQDPRMSYGCGVILSAYDPPEEWVRMLRAEGLLPPATSGPAKAPKARKRRTGHQGGDVLPDGTMVADPANALLELHDQANGTPVPPKEVATDAPVLDACCGSRMFWFDRNDARAVFMDVRSGKWMLKDASTNGGERELQVAPGVVGDFTAMPFASDHFDLVVFDPPHFRRNGKGGWVDLKYGTLGTDWRQQLEAGFKECLRVLRPGGTLVFKWNEADIALRDVLALAPIAPLFGNQQPKRLGTHWVVFLKPSGRPSGEPVPPKEVAPVAPLMSMAMVSMPTDEQLSAPRPAPARSLTALAARFGGDRREREVVKKRMRSLCGKLSTWPADQRQAFIDFITNNTPAS